jgi:Zn-dependent peptidase ImmA (M78 family)
MAMGCQKVAVPQSTLLKVKIQAIKIAIISLFVINNKTLFMPVAYAKINPDILSWARNRAQLSISALAKKLAINEERLEQWENGEESLTFKQAQNFSDKTHIPFGYLFLRHPPLEPLPLPDLRTVSSEQITSPSVELRDIITIVLQRQSWYSEYLIEQGELKNPVVACCEINTPVANIVHSIRTYLKLGVHPERGNWEDYFRDLVRKIEGIGILVMRQADVGHHTRPLSVAEFRGFAVADPIAPVIFINQNDSQGARLFTLIHELAHIWIGRSGISDGSPDIGGRQEEVVCNAVAAEFLVPEAEFLPMWNDDLDSWQDNLAPLEAHFHVSQWVLARRAQSLGKISLLTYQKFVKELHEKYRNRESNNKSGPSYYVTKHSQISDRFSKAVVSDALSGRLLLRDAGQLLGIKPNNIVNYARELGI